MTRSRIRGTTAGPARAAVAALLAVGLAACQGNGEEAAPRRVSLSAATTTPIGTAAAAQGARPLPAGGPLEPGGYRTTRFQPALGFRVGPGWEVAYAEEVGSVELGRDVDPTAPFEGKYLTFLRVEQVFATPLLTDQQLAGDQERYLRPVPDDLVGWLRRHPHLRTSAPKRVRIGGVPAAQIDVAVKKLPARPDTCVDLNPRQCVVMFPYPGGPAVVLEVPGAPTRYFVLDVEGPPLVIAVTSERAHTAFLAEAEKVLATVRFQ